MSLLINELNFSLRERALWWWAAVVFVLSLMSVILGVLEVRDQSKSIDQLIEGDRQERAAAQEKVKDWGSAAYYSFHLTYDRPSAFAFAAMGQRDDQPWKHRIRMLALEGQIYERDVANPSAAVIGRFDFAFLVAYLLPLILIIVLYGLMSSERNSGRFALLEATAGAPASLWRMRAVIRVAVLLGCLLAPFIIAALASKVAFAVLVTAMLAVVLYTFFWGVLCYWVASWRKSGSVILMSLIGIWVLVSVVIPSGAKLAIDRAISLPAGAEILLTQRESVNDAWDLPREQTMQAFFERHPEWSDYSPDSQGFEWQWYYAFQQVGDQKTERLTKAYIEGRIRRDRLAGLISWLAPPVLLERTLQSLAKTDFSATIAYEQAVRHYHAELRAFYYPKFFTHQPFIREDLANLPIFSPRVNLFTENQK